jgi:5-(carboxyamino)imidazole ribonucleotide synthase
MFIVDDAAGQRVLVNELAPRPHNSGHYTIEACVTSQFEQHIRAICGLPLGDTTLRQPAAMKNLLGDIWPRQASKPQNQPDWPLVLKQPACHLHLYGKHEPRPGRKMGHITCLCDSDPKSMVMQLDELERTLAGQ